MRENWISKWILMIVFSYCMLTFNFCGKAENDNRLSRKNPIKQASLIGFDTLFLLLMRRLTIKKMVQVVADRIGLKGRALICPYAEVGMDVDKPFQYEILCAELDRKTGA